MLSIGIIGAGASGMMAAIIAAKQGAKVTLLEKNDRIGKKILATGNGKCNFSNRNLTSACYFSTDYQICEEVWKGFGVEDTLSFFADMGMRITDRNGMLYPASGQAATVLELLRMELKKYGVDVRTEQQVQSICKKRGFLVKTQNDAFSFDRLLLTCGGKASPQTGSDGSGYQFAKEFSHKIITPLPALVQLRCAGDYWKGIAGVRVDGIVALYIDGKLPCMEEGEIQITDYGISGIPVFQLSRFVAIALNKQRRVTVSIDLLPDIPKENIAELIANRLERHSEKTAEEFMCGVLAKKLIVFALRQCQIKPTIVAKEISQKRWEGVFAFLKSWEVLVTKTNSFEQAQVCSGGVSLAQVKATMESKLVEGLYFAGEILDVDGRCGGYNLQWAWSSGYVAGENATKS